jgi:hypothetical protein
VSRLYKKASVQNQLHILCVYLEKHFPELYADHLENRSKGGVGDCAIKAFEELNERKKALGRFIMYRDAFDRSIQKEEEEFQELEKMIPLPVILPGDAINPAKTRPITLDESYSYAEQFKPVFVNVSAGEGLCFGNIVGHFENEKAEFLLDIDVCGDIQRLPIASVFVEVE